MKRVLLLDDDVDLCLVLSEIMNDLGSSEFLCTHSLDDLKKIKEKLSFIDIVLLDVNLGDNQPTGLDAYDWIMESGYIGKIIFFTGHARSNPLVQVALKLPKVTLLEKPATVSEIKALVS